jgi:hypothetical protein
MKRSLRAVVAFSLLFAALSTGAAAAPPQADDAVPQAPSHVASAFGRAVVAGQETFVHVTVAGVSAERAEAAAVAQLQRRGAVPVQSAEYTKNGTWKQFSDNSAGNDWVAFYWSTYGQGSLDNYLASGGSPAVTAWNDVATSSFEFSYGGKTDACPSLVDDCPASQAFNGVNEAGWVGLGPASSDGSITLGVTWFNFRTRGGPFAAPQETDVALNSDATWGVGGFDVLIVAAHEFGHAAGLGHSSDTDALMYPWYQERAELLGADDIAGISALYPATDGGSDDSGKVPGYCNRHPDRDGCPQ